MLNYTFDGRIKSSAGANVSGAYYQAYFYKVNAGSTTSQWNAVRQTSADGYYNFNLGDGDFLTQTGVASPGDIVVIAVWENEATRTGYTKDHFDYVAETVSAANVYTLNITSLGDHIPSTMISLPSYAIRYSATTLTNNSTDNYLSSIYYQYRNYSSVEIFQAIGISSCYVQWGDSTSSQIGSGNGSHAWSGAPGSTYIVSAQTIDNRGNSGNIATATIGIRARAPSGGLAWVPPTPTIFDTITFTPGYTDPDAQTSSVVYKINGATISSFSATPSAGGYQRVLTPWTARIVTPGSHTITQVLNYWTGFESSSVTYDQTLTIANTPPCASYSATTASVPTTQFNWTSTSVDIDGTIANYVWELQRADGFGGWNHETSSTGGTTSSFVYRFAISDTYRLRLTVTDNLGATCALPWDVFFVTVSESGGSGGTTIIYPGGVWGLIR